MGVDQDRTTSKPTKPPSSYARSISTQLQQYIKWGYYLLGSTLEPILNLDFSPSVKYGDNPAVMVRTPARTTEDREDRYVRTVAKLAS